eukprot:2521341-Rhodomonas_salina.1
MPSQGRLWAHLGGQRDSSCIIDSHLHRTALCPQDWRKRDLVTDCFEVKLKVSRPGDLQYGGFIITPD